MTNVKTPITDTTFIRKSGLKGGGLELFEAIQSGKMMSSSISRHLEIPKNIGEGKHVVILGAGVGGLTAAYELLKSEAKYQVTVLEALDRVGGRSLTLRPGDSFTEMIDGLPVTQTCDFDQEPWEDYPPYLNAGPGRIPSAHRNVLNLCKELEVELEVYIMQTRSNRLYSQQRSQEHGPEITANWQNRRISNDTRGFIAEYLYKCVDDITDLNEVQREEFKSLLITFGRLEKKDNFQFEYEGSSRSGYTILPGVHSPGEIKKPILFQELLASAFWKLSFYQPEDFLWQETSFQPTGGMDMIEKALEREIKQMGGHIFLRSMVKHIKPIGDGRYEIQYQRGVSEESIKADICISNIPIPLLNGKIDVSGFSEEYAKALTKVVECPDFLSPTCKVGWQADRSLWQNPERHNEVPIFGGISYTSNPMVQMWYPSDNFHAELGTLTGAYNYTKNATEWGKLQPEERLKIARDGAKNLHGKEFADGLRKGVTIAWQNIPTQRGGWNDWSKVSDSKEEQVHIYNTLIEGDNNFYITGDQVSHLPGWKEGAVASALHVLALVAQVKGYVIPRVDTVPDTAALIHPWHG